MFKRLLYVWFSFNGSISRKSYILYYIIPIASLFVALLVIAASYGVRVPGEETGSIRYEITPGDNVTAFFVFIISLIILMIGITWGLFASGVKRLHDMRASGWWILVMLLPINFILIGVLILVPGISASMITADDASFY